MADWKTIEDLFVAAAELPVAERAGFLDASCGGDQSLREEVESLLAFDSDKSRPLAPIVQAGAAMVFRDGGFLDAPFRDEKMIGLRLGAYVIAEAIGHGGMGSVYLATRADDQFQRKVAVKLIRRGMDTPAAVERFLRERQILANLDHPYIGKLLDGGATAEGFPYFVMEYIQGRPVDEYCEKHGLGIEAKCEIFRKICAAVSYAHRNLVVHRDLKPTNILVTEDGSPVLLDFGIAKLLDATAPADQSHTAGAWMLTPDYASPEQVRGLPTNTSTDVYSLGVVLYQLLTGSKPLHVDSTTPLVMARTVCEDAPRRPSDIAKNRKLAGDLDNIVLTALRKEPERRYQSADQFSEDIRRYLKGLPVLAREDTFRYRASKFVRRNQVGVLATAMAAAILLAGVVVTSWEAHRVGQALRVAEKQQHIAETQRAVALAQSGRAEREHQAALHQEELAVRSERRAVERADEAEIQRGKAQRRLTDLVELGRRSLFDVQGTLERLPGALEARRDIIVTTRQYLDGLAADAVDDPAVLAMLVTGYTQTGDVLGVPARPNLGDSKGAVEAWRKAREILVRIEKLQPRNARAQFQDLGLRQRVGMVLESQGNPTEALAEYHAALAIAHDLAKNLPADPVALAQPGIIEHNMGTVLWQMHAPAAADHFRAEVTAYERAIALLPGSLENRLGLATAFNDLGQVLVSEHRLAQSLEQYRRSLAIREEVQAEHPGDGVAQSGIARSWFLIAETLAAPWQENLGDPVAALEACGKGLAIYETLQAADRGNRKATGDLALALVDAGAIGRNTAQLRRGAEMLTELRVSNPKQVAYRNHLALAHEYLGHALRDAGDKKGAMAEYRLSLDVRDQPALAAQLAQLRGSEEGTTAEASKTEASKK